MKPKNTTVILIVDMVPLIEELTKHVLSINEDSPRYLSKLSLILSRMEAVVNYEAILRAVIKSSQLNFNKAIRNHNEAFLHCKVISRIIQRLTLANNYNWSDDQLLSCALDIFYKCRDWNMADMVYFIYQVRTNPYSRKEFVKERILPSDLMNMISVYNDMRAIEHERLIRTLELEALEPRHLNDKHYSRRHPKSN